MKTTSPQQALDATKRAQYVNKDVLDTWPQTTGELEYFKLDKYVTAEELDKEYESRGLLPAPFAMCAADGPIMDEKEYVATQWKDAHGKFCYLTFHGWDGGRGVSCDRSNDDWYVDWWFAGVRKSSAKLSTPENSSDALPLAALEERVDRMEQVMREVAAQIGEAVKRLGEV